MLLAAVIGFLFGFIGSMPVAGPIAVLVFARAVEGQMRAAVAVAAGGALAEGAYAFLAFWGFTALLARYELVVPLSKAVAAVLLLVLGALFIRRREEAKPTPRRSAGWGGGFFLGFSIAALNPTLIATWAGATTTLFSTGLVRFTPAMAGPFAAAAGSGIVAWFVVLVLLVRRYRGRFSPATLQRVLQVTGVLLIAIGLWFAVDVARFLLR